MGVSITYNLDALPEMKKYPDKYFGLAVVDPPYGINATDMKMGSHPNRLKDGKTGPGISTAVKIKGRLNHGNGKLKNRLLNQSIINWDNQTPSKEYFDELFRISENQIIWGGITLIFRLPGVLSAGIKCNRGKIFRNGKWLGLLLTNLL